MLDDNHLLLRNYYELLLLKIDYHSLRVNLISKTASGFRYYWIILDQLNPNNFLNHSCFGFATGKLIGDKIVCSPRQEFDFTSIKYPKLAGNIVFALQSLNRRYDVEVLEFKYCEINLATMEKKITEVHSNLSKYYCYDWHHTVNFLFLYLISIYFSHIAGMRIGCIFLLKTLSRYVKF
jgi:hypothetical protein